MEFKDGDFEKMAALQKELTAVLLKANQQRVPAHLATFALIRCLRPLLDLHNDQSRLALIDLFEAFLRHASVESKLLVM
jgi:hypothetical protein